MPPSKLLSGPGLAPALRLRDGQLSWTAKPSRCFPSKVGTGTCWERPATAWEAGKREPVALTKSKELRKGGDGHDWFCMAMTQWTLG